MHKILAWRMLENLEFSSLQFAFLKRDRCMEASMLLHSILKTTHEDVAPMALAFLDISKAFDTISHTAILNAAKKAGTPQPLLNYLSHLYSTSKLYIDTTTILCGRGVKQGDPLSPILFILAMNEVVMQALPEKGIKLRGEHIDALAYADDLILFAENGDDLQLKLDELDGALTKMGMDLSQGVSRS